LRIPHGSLSLIACAPSPCGPSLAVSRLAGRYPDDYCGHSVAIGLASLRRSHVHTAIRQHDLGVPSVSLNVLTGHRSCTPEDCGAPLAITPQGPAPVSGVFPAGVKVAPSGDWVSSNSTFTVSRGSPGTPSRTPGHDCRFSAMLLSRR
jgi:hypothetical protein